MNNAKQLHEEFVGARIGSKTLFGCLPWVLLYSDIFSLQIVPIIALVPNVHIFILCVHTLSFVSIFVRALKPTLNPIFQFSDLCGHVECSCAQYILECHRRW